MKALYLESIAGIAGDMFAASFIDAGLVTAEELTAIPAKLGLDGVSVEITRPLRATMRTTHIDVTWSNESWKKAVSHDHAHAGFGQAAPHAHSHANILNPRAPAPPHWHTHYQDLDRFLARSKLDDATRELARTVFRLIAEAEADAHGMSLEDVAFHEVGAVDSIVDVAMAAHCVAKVAPRRVYATPVKLGRGLVKIEHGTHAVPPPAAARLVQGMPVAAVPDSITRENVELSTPTGLAILKALNPEFVSGVPAGTIRAQGMGSGTMDLGAYPNVFRVMLIEDAAPEKHEGGALPYESDRVVELACNIDDETAERTAWVCEQLLAQGALDVWIVPITGKKGRAAISLHLLTEPALLPATADWLLRHSSTFGVRYRDYDRLKLVRRFEKRQTPQGELTFKVGLTTDGKVLKEKPEFEELRKRWDRELSRVET